jgi:hypothetical protein
MTTKKALESYCFSCESLLLTDEEKHGPFCRACFQKTKRKDPLTRAAIARTVVAVVPTICPHDGHPHGRCRYSGVGQFNVIVLDKRLEPVEITGPYTLRAAERRAKVLRSRFRKDRN